MLIPFSLSTGVIGVGVVGRLMLFGRMALGLVAESLHLVISIWSMGTVVCSSAEKSVDEDAPALSVDITFEIGVAVIVVVTNCWLMFIVLFARIFDFVSGSVLVVCNRDNALKMSQLVREICQRDCA